MSGYAKDIKGVSEDCERAIQACVALEDVACDLEGYAMHIREYLRGETETLPMRWDIQDAFEKFKAAVEYG